MQFWLNNPSILFNNKYVFDLWPQPNMSISQKMNAISRIVILLTLKTFSTKLKFIERDSDFSFRIFNYSALKKTSRC